MKKLFLFLTLIILTTSCSLDDDKSNTNSYTYEILALDSYVVPATFTLGETYEIKLKYQKPSSCHIYQGIYYAKDLNIRTIGIQTAVQNDQMCTKEFPPLSEVSFKFIVTNTGSYIFKFYKGKDANGKSVFEEKEIQVVN